MPELIDYCARMQQVYGGSIVTFLGAVHWGLAMQSQTIAGERPQRCSSSDVLLQRVTGRQLSWKDGRAARGSRMCWCWHVLCMEAAWVGIAM
jgi:hypothetical protein